MALRNLFIYNSPVYDLELPLKEEVLDFGLSPALDDNMSIQSVDLDIWRVQWHSQRLHNIISERIHIALRLLQLGQLSRSAGFGDEINGKLVRGRATDKVGEVRKWERRRWSRRHG